MNALGIVVEHNPFHNGHLFHLEKSKDAANADYSIGFMSGNFVQRGEPAIINKWFRAQAAVQNGVDLVFEIPSLFATASASYFAFGSIFLMDATNVCSSVVFGSEINNIELLKDISKFLANESEDYKDLLKYYLKKGLSFAKSRQMCLEHFYKFKFSNYDKDEYISTVSNSNAILALEYIKSLYILNSKIEPLSIERISNNYNDESITSNIASATAIRKLIFSKDYTDEKLKNVVPKHTFNIINLAKKHQKLINFNDITDDILLKVLNSSKKELLNIYEMTENFENRMKREILLSNDFSDFFDRLSFSRFTNSKMRRTLLRTYLNIDKSFHEVDDFPRYLRILAFNDKGKELLKEIKKKAKLPIISNIKNANKTVKTFNKNAIKNGLKEINIEKYQKQLELDVKLEKIYNFISLKNEKLSTRFNFDINFNRFQYSKEFFNNF